MNPNVFPETAILFFNMETWSSSLDFSDLKNNFGSPMYIFNPDAVIQNLEDFSALTLKKNIFFPVKANPHPRLINLLIRLGAGFDCASAYEIHLVLHCGGCCESIIYNSPVLDIPLAIEVAAKGGKVVANSFEIFKKLETFLPKNHTGSLFLRWNPAVEMQSSLSHVLAHGNSLSKFGMTSDEVLKICSQTKLTISGIHTHVGSRINDLSIFSKTMNELHQLCDTIETTSNQQIHYLNLGGGLGVNLDGKNRYPKIKEFTRVLNPLKQSKYEYCLEPGNSLVSNSVGLLCSILETKESQNKKWGFLDVGTNQLINWIALKSPHQILCKNKVPLPLEGPDSLGGPLCFAGDILLSNTILKEHDCGDPFFIQHCGSYCYAIANHFNGFLSPGWVEVDLNNKQSQLIHSKEYAKFISTESKLKVVFEYD